MSGSTGGKDRAFDPDSPSGLELEDETQGGRIEPDAELAAALREAADAVPDPEPKGRARSAGPGAPTKRSLDPNTGELLLDDPVHPGSEETELERLRREVTEANDRLIRLQADFENFRKRALKERQEALQYGPQNLVKDLLSTVDNLERAIDHARLSEGGNLESLLQGVELVYRELLGVFGNHQITEIDALGKTFNPALHEAMGQVPDATVEPNTVIEVLEKGYQLRDRLVRPARVVVARAPDEPGAGEGEAAD